MTGKPESARPGLASLRQASTDSRAVQSYYDDLAARYDDTLAQWQYRAPDDVSALLAPHLAEEARVLDIGCGTGLLGKALRGRGAWVIDGIDISAASLEQAGQRGCYARLMRQDLQRLPLPVPDAAYDAAALVGVMSYIEDADALLRDLCRSVRLGGMIAFTQRTDFWQERDFPALIARLEQDGLWTAQHISTPQDYIPGHEDFTEEIKVIHVLCMVC